jgi:hypothetical protein
MPIKINEDTTYILLVKGTDKHNIYRSVLHPVKSSSHEVTILQTLQVYIFISYIYTYIKVARFGEPPALPRQRTLFAWTVSVREQYRPWNSRSHEPSLPRHQTLFTWKTVPAMNSTSAWTVFFMWFIISNFSSFCEYSGSNLSVHK